MVESRGNHAFTTEEVANIHQLFPSISCDNKLLELAQCLQEYIWRLATEDGLSPCREIAAMALVLLRVQKYKQLVSQESSVMTAMFNSLPEEAKIRLPPQSLGACLTSLQNNQQIVSEQASATEDTKHQPATEQSLATGNTENPPATDHSSATEDANRNKRKREWNETTTIHQTYQRISTITINRIDSNDATSQVGHHDIDHEMPAAEPTRQEAANPGNGVIPLAIAPHQPSETSVSVSLQILEKALSKPISILLRLDDGTLYKAALVTQFHDTSGVKSRQAFGFTYKLFAMMFQTDRFHTSQDNWNILVASQQVISTNDGTIQLPANLLSSVADLCKGFAKLAKSEAKGLEYNVRYWNILYELELHKANFAKELDQYATTHQKLDKINEQIKLLGIDNNGSELCTTAVGRNILSHLESLYRGIANLYGFRKVGDRLRNRQAALARSLIETFGKGVLGVLALQGYKAL